MLKIKSAKKNEKGIALIFTLIMLSLLMILALSFALDSMFEQKAAYNSASSSSSGFMGQAQLKQVLLLLKEGEANFDSDGYLYSLDSGTPTATDKDMLADGLLVEGVLETGDSCLIKVNWNYVRDADGNIVGRTAFIVIPDDKIPLDSLISSTYDEILDAEPRIGKDVSELNIRPTISSVTNAIINVFNWKEDEPVNGEGFTGGGYLGSWSSYEALIAAIELATTLTATQQGDIESGLAINTPKEMEAFWGDSLTTGTIGLRESGEDYSRFNLSRTDWDKVDNAADIVFLNEEILYSPDSGTKLPTVAMQQWNDTDTAATKVSGLPWLALFGYDNTGTEVSPATLGRFSTTYDHRCQVAANFKDYCDRDKDSSGNYIDSDGNPIIRPTSDVDPVLTNTPSWLTQEPAFTGNEETPYINKVAVQLAVSVGTVDMGGGVTDYYSIIKIHPYVELINIFADGFDSVFCSKLKIRIVGTINVTVYDEPQSFDYQSEDLDFDQTLDVLNAWDTELGKGHKFLKLSSVDHDFPDNSAAHLYFSGLITGPGIKVDINSITVSKVILYNKNDSISRGYDYVKTLKTISPSATDTTVFNGNSGTNYSWYGWAVDDPRQNLNQNDWANMGTTLGNDPTLILSLEGPAPYTGKPNAENTDYGGAINTIPPNAVSALYDPEIGKDPSDRKLSTAFIRNGPMESPWELGFIHRGMRWQTINLKKYDVNKAVKDFTIGAYNYIGGGQSYSSGDANILDQVKMTAEAQSPAKINLRSINDTALSMLFRKVQYDCPIDSDMAVSSMTSGGTAIVADDYRDAVKGKYPTTSEDDMRTRASVVDVLVPPSADTDAVREEIIGKIVNLTKIEQIGSDGFTIIVLAQTIKDIGTSGGISITKTSFDGSQTATKTCTLGVFDADTSNSDSSKHVYFDEITGIQKLKIMGVISAGEVEITSFKYVD